MVQVLAPPLLALLLVHLLAQFLPRPPLLLRSHFRPQQSLRLVQSHPAPGLWLHRAKVLIKQLPQIAHAQYRLTIVHHPMSPRLSLPILRSRLPPPPPFHRLVRFPRRETPVNATTGSLNGQATHQAEVTGRVAQTNLVREPTLDVTFAIAKAVPLWTSAASPRSAFGSFQQQSERRDNKCSTSLELRVSFCPRRKLSILSDKGIILFNHNFCIYL